jgi:hypothetical protein
MMAHIFYNDEYGGFRWPKPVIEKYKEITGKELYPWGRDDKERSDPLLVKLMFEVGKEHWETVDVREVPDGTRYYIEEYDGNENVVTKSERKWATARDD